MRQNKPNRYTPLLMAVSVVVGILIGTFYANHLSGNKLNIIKSGSNRLNNLLHIINDQYVDTVNIDSLVDKAVPQILSDLDPHSVYIRAKDVQSVTDDLKGSFSGIGVQFVIREDTIRVQGIVKNGPAERAGIVAGDKIISIDDKPFVGKVVTNEETIKRLKGPKGTKVKIGILKYKEKKPTIYTITRNDIPVKSIPATYMLDDETGYIRINSFGETTYPEMLISLARLSQEGFSSLVIDLRDNPGGYLESAIQIANEFLPNNKLIVYTEGRKSPRQEYRSDGHGSYKNIPLVILINEGSASASEIIAGAMQDNDRATIIGRRSFGKGLVQQQLGFTDGSLIRLTVARYYTPSGRCIQKPYEAGNSKGYEEDIIDRYEHGEFFSQDSIKHTGPKYHTSLGRIVYGGGGVTPDIFIPEDTTDITSYSKEAVMSGLIQQFAFVYTDNNRQKMSKYDDMHALAAYLKKQNIVDMFASYADKQGLKRRNLMIKKSYKMLERHIISRIIYNMLEEEDWTKYINQDDNAIKKTLEIFKKGESFPQKPEVKTQVKSRKNNNKA
ncbi:MAG: S41 family peptidase [Prevotella sp.]|nr:S41 family peptidase [Prevotella sp.]